MDWPGLLRWLAIALALAGGLLSLIAFAIGRRGGAAPADAQRSHVAYLLSYILMSLSIFFLALQGLIAG